MHVRVPAGGRGAVQGHRRRVHLADPQVPAPAVAGPLAAVRLGGCEMSAALKDAEMEESSAACLLRALAALRASGIILLAKCCCLPQSVHDRVGHSVARCFSHALEAFRRR